MNTNEIRETFLNFCKQKGHAIVPSASLVPENDPTTLFTGSGMQPMLPYLLGEEHPLGSRIADSQKSFRSGDIEEVGDNRHTTFFEMLGNWSFGDYFQKEQLTWIFEFLITGIGLDPRRLYVTVFSGDSENGLPRDESAGHLWKELFAQKGIEATEIDLVTEERGSEVGMQDGRIFYYGEKNWWSRAGQPSAMPIGEPGGQDSELFYEFPQVEHDPRFGKRCHPNCDCGRYLEIGNSVFMQYLKIGDKKFSLLPKKNIDFGGGLERIAMASQDTADIIKLDIFKDLITYLEEHSGKSYDDKNYTSAFRIIADHIRAAIFLTGDGVLPGNSERGYFVRRLIRRSVRYWDKLGIKESGLYALVDPLLEYYMDAYPETYKKQEDIKCEIKREEEKFRKTLAEGLKQFDKIYTGFISGAQASTLYQSYGFPIELITELARERGGSVDTQGFKEEMKKHQDLSRSGSEKKFKGGLGDTSLRSIKYHTATHLLNAVLKEVLGDHIKQRGSNITPERLRFDFSHPEKLNDWQKQKIEDLINQKIAEALPVVRVQMPRTEAEKIGAEMEFGAHYPDQVSVYIIKNTDGTDFSKEFCGGPHVENTKDLGRFKIIKEESVSAGVRRIKAILE